MKTFTLLSFFLVFSFTKLSAQQFDTIAKIIDSKVIEDVTFMGNTMFAAMADSGVYKSTDDGYNWTPCTTLPDAGFGTEGAFAVFAASNGELIVGANTIFNGSPFAGVVYRSTDMGNTWTQAPVTAMGGYETADVIVELPNGNLIMKTSTSKLYKSTLTDTAWTQVTTPGGVIYGFNSIGNTLYVVNNPAGGTAGIWYSTDSGLSWNRYGVNGTNLNLGTVTVCPILAASNYKFVGIGGTSPDRGVYRSGINDTLWVQKNGGITNTYLYPTSMATDNNTVWMIFEGVNQCYLTSTTDFGDNWSSPIGQQPTNAGSALCMKKLIVYKTHLYAYAYHNLYRIANVAQNTSVNELNNHIMVRAYPNPVLTNNLTIDIQSNRPFKTGNLEIKDILGKTVYSTTINHNDSNIQLSLKGYKQGIYFIRVQLDEEMTVVKFVKQ